MYYGKINVDNAVESSLCFIMVYAFPLLYLIIQ